MTLVNRPITGQLSESFPETTGRKTQPERSESREEEDQAAFVLLRLHGLDHPVPHPPYPSLLWGSSSSQTSSGRDRNGFALTVSLVKLGHLLSFATAWGAALWESAEAPVWEPSGQDVPCIFLNLSVCVAITVAAFAYLHPWKSASTMERYQLGFLLSSFGFNLSNLLVFTPMTIEMMKKRHKLERELNMGDEVGWSKNVPGAKVNPKLAAMNKKFGMIHGLSSLANIMSFGSLAMHSWYLTSKLQL
ncbi:unnamed protein product [Spirodela intermedia]|uniref:TMEM205-like domain-containing protein n=1 Tax=Spirodela intermedia TaxID=51605 RepID=A0A7I8IW45_SPIIN|nr:unnamed protein product [Spirodela intermedia]CAA6661990.1 unnamed protein product [Spirodela intermedia]